MAWIPACGIFIECMDEVGGLKTSCRASPMFGEPYDVAQVVSPPRQLFRSTDLKIVRADWS